MNKNKKKKILFICDDPRFFSGVGVMSKELIKQTIHKYDYAVIAGAHQHPEQGKVVDISQAIGTEANVVDAYCRLYPCNGYGDANIIFQLIDIEKPDAICMITDPRFYGWLFAIETQIHSLGISINYITIWDNLPYPMWNRPFYDSCDSLLAISKQTYNITKWVCDPLNCISLEGSFDIDGNLIKE